VRITGSCSLPFDVDKTYKQLHDPEVLAPCVPGCEAIEKLGEDEYAMQVKLAFAPFSGVFTGKIKITGAAPPHRFKLLVEGRGHVGFLKGEGLMNLSSTPAGTELTYDGDVQVGGAIAAAGQRVIDATAKTMIRKFFERFIEEVNKQP
jgi:carbon monoxide dehydrogenase subunit G